ncbi:MAG: mannosyltransferase [Ginsengibacter sp.]
MDKYLHIVCFDVPYPPDYGGVSDIFYKIKTLHEEGVKIILHCFEYGRGEHPELNLYCENVIYYPRKKKAIVNNKLPYIVASRINKTLEDNLSKDNHPILIEGIHCSYLVYNNKLKDRKVLIRLHNVEYLYYQYLCKIEYKPLRKLYFYIESQRLKKYEMRLALMANFLAINEKDRDWYQETLKAKNIKWLPAFVAGNQINSLDGLGEYCLYQGNLSVIENEMAALWLMEKIFTITRKPLIIAGKNPSTKLKKLLKKFPGVQLVSNPLENEMLELTKNAQIILAPSFNITGSKIKLFNALIQGRHVLSNAAGVAGSGLENLCILADTEEQFISKINEYFTTTFTQHEKDRRSTTLFSIYNNRKNAIEIMEQLF